MDIDYPEIVNHVKTVVNQHDITFVEGAGGITTPLTKDITFTNLMTDITYPAILVADGRLGSINRVVLTYEYAKTASY